MTRRSGGIARSLGRALTTGNGLDRPEETAGCWRLNLAASCLVLQRRRPQQRYTLSRFCCIAATIGRDLRLGRVFLLCVAAGIGKVTVVRTNRVHVGMPTGEAPDYVHAGQEQQTPNKGTR